MILYDYVHICMCAPVSWGRIGEGQLSGYTPTNSNCFCNISPSVVCHLWSLGHHCFRQ